MILQFYLTPEWLQENMVEHRSIMQIQNIKAVA